MSNSQSMIAFPASFPPDAFAKHWANLEPCSRTSHESLEAAMAWSAKRDGYLSGPQGHTVKLIFRDGDWNVVIDFSMLMSADDGKLADFSKEVQKVLCEYTQGTTGCAGFSRFELGECIRKIDYSDGEVSETGQTLNEEKSIDLSNLYDEELEKLWRAHGLSGLFFNAKITGLEAFEFIDNYESQPFDFERHPKALILPVKKSWWKFW
ncbi:MAG: hypothetical protein L6R28_21510 [Planctomycetes bacterium]|nr:hypothetical protein [Planctomycetota bacterium]